LVSTLRTSYSGLIDVMPRHVPSPSTAKREVEDRGARYSIPEF
jgi:hypothetical protein